MLVSFVVSNYLGGIEAVLADPQASMLVNVVVTIAVWPFVESGFEGVFQLASMHPEYCFDGVDYDDASNFTNRSPYPIIHIIREASMAKVLSVYKTPEKIPDDNITLAHDKGANYFQQVLTRIHQQHS